MEELDKIGLIDLDGTVANYDKALADAMRPLFGPEEIEFTGWDNVPDHIRERRDLVKRQPGFWRSLPRIEHGFEVVQDMFEIGYELHALTKGPVKTTNAWTEKVEWCQEHMPYSLVTITQDKSLVYGRVLFDDFPTYFTRWLAVRPRGLVVCLAQPWNREYAKDGKLRARNILRYDGSNREELRELLQRAYDRKAGQEF